LTAICHCNRRKRGKYWMTCESSRFLKELPKDELVYAGGYMDAVPTLPRMRVWTSWRG
jgi:superfamily I DNA/RNA helicase